MALYQLKTILNDINRFYFSFFSKENISVAMAMQIFYFSIKKNIFQFIYPSYGYLNGIIKLRRKSIIFLRIYTYLLVMQEILKYS